MSPGQNSSPRLRTDLSTDPVSPVYLANLPTEELPEKTSNEALQASLQRTTQWLIDQQHADGYWVGELEGDTILESEYILLLTWLGRENSEVAKQAAAYMLTRQMPEGGWSLYPGGPIEISASVKAYLALKITGHDPQAEYMQRACRAIREAGGAERVNSFTRYYLALLGIIGYHQCPAVPPELMLIPRWAPFNIYEMSSWSRTIVIPLSILWSCQPVRQLPQEWLIDELFLNKPSDLPVTMAKSETLDDLKSKTWIDWEWFFQNVDRTWKQIERFRIRPFRKMAVKKAEQWMLQRFEKSDGLGAIFPPIIWSVVALKCLGYSEECDLIQNALQELEKLSIKEGDLVRLQPCKSPVWDTAIATIALRESGVPATHPAIRKSVDWLLSKEVKQLGDWAALNRGHSPGGWYFEFNNEFYPDIDDTIMVMMALRRCLPRDEDPRWTADILDSAGSLRQAEQRVEEILSSTDEPEADLAIEILQALQRGAMWTMAMQSRNGGWGAFDKDNTRELFTRVPFADHNAMIDPPTADISARVLEMFGTLGVTQPQPFIQKALKFIWEEQEYDAAWYGRWGVHYLYGTWQCIVGLTKVGIPPEDARIQAAAHWLKLTQQESGGWGETPSAYDDPSLRGQGNPTPSQTAWALMGLMAAGEVRSEAVSRGIQYLIDTQLADGTWTEEDYTGTGFPRVFYLRYHLYKIYFPLMALGRYAELKSNAVTAGLHLKVLPQEFRV